MDDQTASARVAWAGCVLAAIIACTASAQQPMGSVDLARAEVSGGLSVSNGRALLLTNDAVTARAGTAVISLARGGTVDVCSTSQFHLLHSGLGASLLFALDRGAVELHSIVEPQDAVLTPDLRFEPSSAGELDLRLRVTPNGDTCVENRGAGSPSLDVHDAFGTGMYRVMPGQHVLFEHGHLGDVVDRESSPCGCPATAPATLASAGSTPAQRAAAEHPFPAAESQGLAAAAASPAAAASAAPLATAPPGVTETQLSAQLSYGEHAAPDSRATPAIDVTPATNGTPAANTAWPPPLPAPTPQPAAVLAPAADAGPATPPPSPPSAHDIAHALRRFFRRLFGRAPSS